MSDEPTKAVVMLTYKIALMKGLLMGILSHEDELPNGLTDQIKKVLDEVDDKEDQ